MWDLLACSSALLRVAHSLTSAARSLRAVVLGDYWKRCWRGPSCGQGLLFPSATLPPSSLLRAVVAQASRGLCSAVVRGTTYINGGCLACAHQQRVGWGIVRTGCGALATLVPEDFPYGCASRAGPPVGVTPWCCRGTRAMARSPGWGVAPA